MKDTIEKYIGETVLQDGFTVKLGDEVVNVAKPTVGTLIEVSKYISMLPQLTEEDSKNRVLSSVIANAKDCEVLGEIAATLVLGRKKINEMEDEAKRPFSIFRKKKVQPGIRKRVAEDILNSCTSKELFELVFGCLDLQHLGFFLSIITTLNEANLLKKTTTTVSGR